MKFLDDIVARHAVCPGPQMVLDMILCAFEKSNKNINCPMMNKFRSFVDNNKLKELYMHGCRFTWNSEREAPTLRKIDKSWFWWTGSWLGQTTCCRRALSMCAFNHAPLHLTTNATYWPKKRFRFETFWVKLEGFEQAVRDALVCDPTIMDPFKRLELCFSHGDRGKWATSNCKWQLRCSSFFTWIKPWKEEG